MSAIGALLGREPPTMDGHRDGEIGSIVDELRETEGHDSNGEDAFE